jgi:hypothetical protein
MPVRRRALALPLSVALLAVTLAGAGAGRAGGLPGRSAERTLERSLAGAPARNAYPKLLETVQAELQTAQNEHALKLAPIEQGFGDLGLSAEAAECRVLAGPMEARLFSMRKLPKEVQPPLSAQMPARERELRLALRKLETDFASKLDALSRKALRAGYPSYAYQIVQEVVRHDPDHPQARKILGYKLRGKEWVTPFAGKMLDDGYVWDETFGWLKKSYVKEYHAGRRYFRGWKTADQEAEIRRDFRHAWQIRTDHYLVKTNHSLERGVEIAKTLEQYHDYFMQTFAAFFSTPEQMRSLFQTTGPNSALQVRRDPYEIHYFRGRDEYMQRLKDKVPHIEITNGLYYTSDRVAYFFFDPDQPHPDTLFHEATHQLFYENVKTHRLIATAANFWIVEGIACYMESYQCDDGRSSVGDPRHVRIEAARRRLLADGYYVPLERFSAMGMQEFQSSVDIAKNYSQAAGLAHFFMRYDGGRYHDALVEHLSDIYRVGPRGRSVVRSLAELTGVPFTDLDRQYAAYMRSLGADEKPDVKEAAASGR